MTVPTTYIEQTFTGDGVTEYWGYTFPIILDTDILVYTTVIATGVTTQVLTGFAVDSFNNRVQYPTVVSGLPKLPATSTITLRRIEPITQLLDLINQGTFNAENLEAALDKITMILQQLNATNYSGYSGYSGINGASGFSGYSGQDGSFSASGFSGYSGDSGFSGFSGANPGASGYSGYSGFSGKSGYSGANPGASGYSGFSGYSGTPGSASSSGYSGYSGARGISGYSGYSGFSGTNISGGINSISFTGGGWNQTSGTYAVIGYLSYLKVDGVDTLNVYVYAHSNSINNQGYLRTTVSTTTPLIVNTNLQGYVLLTGTIDVSGLVNGNVYQVLLEAKYFTVSSITAFGA